MIQYLNDIASGTQRPNFVKFSNVVMSASQILRMNSKLQIFHILKIHWYTTELSWYNTYSHSILVSALSFFLNFISFHFIYFILFYFILFHFISFYLILFHFISFYFILSHFFSFYFILYHFISYNSPVPKRILPASLILFNSA